MAVDLPPGTAMTQDQVECVIAASIKYEVPANVMLAIADREGGKPGQYVRNTNGTSDVGPMQFNTAYLAQLSRFGIRPEHAASAGCYPYVLAAWRVKSHLLGDAGSFWSRVANYHSRTTYYNQRYAAWIAPRSLEWATWIEARYPTRVAVTGALPSAEQFNTDLSSVRSSIQGKE